MALGLITEIDGIQEFRIWILRLHCSHTGKWDQHFVAAKFPGAAVWIFSAAGDGCIQLIQSSVEPTQDPTTRMMVVLVDIVSSVG